MPKDYQIHPTILMLVSHLFVKAVSFKMKKKILQVWKNLFQLRFQLLSIIFLDLEILLPVKKQQQAGSFKITVFY